MAALIVLAFLFVIGIVCEGFMYGLVRLRRGRSRRQRILDAQREAARRVDDLYSEARIRMEEAAGRRSPGEHRIGDGFGSWNRW